MESQDELCPHCGKKGYIKYYYLGLHSKVKNWFRNEAMCKTNAVTLGRKRALAWKNFKLASEKRNLGWAKMGGPPVVLGPKPNMDSTNKMCKLHSYHLKVKSDHCSKFSNLSNWKEEA